MYPNVNADYTVVPGVTPVTDTLVTLTDGSIIDVDDRGEVRGILRGPTSCSIGAVNRGGLAVDAAAISISALISAGLTWLAFRQYGKTKRPMSPALVVGVGSLALGALAVALRRAR